MKLHTQNRPVEQLTPDAPSQFSIKTTAKAFKILSDGLYKNKILAFVRELSRNAYDAHIAAGRTNVPFEIHLPNNLEPHFHVKDFGTGLSHDNVIHLYTTYFESTKQESNDFVGALGLGSKSPFSYTSNFTVKSRFDGKESIYTCFLSDIGVPSIVKLGESDYTGYPGLEVTVPIERSDFYNVQVAVQNDLAFWEGTFPNVVGNSAFKVDRPKKLVTSTNGWYTVDRNSWIAREPYAVQGNVGYPISISILEGKAKTDEQRSALGMIKRIKPVITFEIGKLDVTASREELSYDESTIRNLIDRCVNVADEFLKKFMDEMQQTVKQPTELEFRREALTLIGNYSSSYGGDFLTFSKARDIKVTRNKRDYTVQELSVANLFLAVEGVSEFPIARLARRTSYKSSNSFKKDIIGNVLIVDVATSPTIANVVSILSDNILGRLGGRFHYNQHRQVGWWNQHKVVLPRRMKQNADEYANLTSTLKFKSKTFTAWTITNFISAAEQVFILNDQGSFGDRIIEQYVTENPKKVVYVTDYNKRKTTQAALDKFIKTITGQMEGLKFLSVSQLKLVVPVTRARYVTTTVARTIDEVTLYNNAGALASSTRLRMKDFIYSSSSDAAEFNISRVYDGGCSKTVDFSIGDFYFFYELRNKMYLDEQFKRRVDPSNYLNALVAYGILDQKSQVVGLRPAQVKKLTNSKIKGKLIPVSLLDKKLEETVKQDERLINVMKICYVGGFKTSGFSNLLGESSILNWLQSEYGFTGDGKNKYKMMNELTPVLNAFYIMYDTDLRKKAAILEMIRYYPESADKYYKDALVTFITRGNDTDEVQKLQKQLEQTVNAFMLRYPILFYIDAGQFRYSSDRLKNTKAAITHIINYVQQSKENK